MLPALTIGPGLYLLFIDLQNDLDHHYNCDKSDASTVVNLVPVLSHLSLFIS